MAEVLRWAVAEFKCESGWVRDRFGVDYGTERTVNNFATGDGQAETCSV